MNEVMQALYYIALVCDTEEHNSDDENMQWQKCNQNRLNQNFTAIANAIELLRAELAEIKNGSNT